jgi:hypothetical protein
LKIWSSAEESLEKKKKVTPRYGGGEWSVYMWIYDPPPTTTLTRSPPPSPLFQVSIVYLPIFQVSILYLPGIIRSTTPLKAIPGSKNEINNHINVRRLDGAEWNVTTAWCERELGDMSGEHGGLS